MTKHIKSFFHNDSNTFSYVVHCTKSKQCVIIDPCADFDLSSGALKFDSAQTILDYLVSNKLSCQYILETHAHADHLSAAFWLKKQTNAKVGIGKGISKVQQTFASLFDLGPEFHSDGRQFDCLWEHEQLFQVGELEIKVLFTPGHTSDSVSYLIEDHIFVGDTLFAPNRGTARCDFPGGSAETLFNSVQMIYKLPENTKVMLCHDYPEAGEAPTFEASVAEHKKSNVHINQNTSLDDFKNKRVTRDKSLNVPKLLYPSVQVNIRAGELPAPNSEGQIYLKIPVFSNN